MKFVLKFTETDKRKDSLVNVIDTYSLYNTLFYAVTAQSKNSSISINFDDPTSSKLEIIDFTKLQPSCFFGYHIQNKLRESYGENYDKLYYMMTWLPMNEDNFTYTIVVKPILSNTDNMLSNKDKTNDFVKFFINMLEL